MSTYITLRETTLTQLGPKCVQCGYNSDLRALDIVNFAGRGSDLKRSMDRGSYLMRVLREHASGSAEWGVLCANCNRIRMRQNRQKVADERPPKPGPCVVWAPDLEEADVFVPHKWLKDRAAGREIFVLWRGNVYDYLLKALVAACWKDFAAGRGISLEEPTEPVTDYE
jgi:hypothetical protein